jgi:putative flippase GtrA
MYYKDMQVLKFLTTGAIGLLINLGTYRALYAMGVHYLFGSMLAFSVSLIIGFVLQKYWTFKNTSEKISLQFTLYAFVAVCNLAFNTVVVFVSVTYGGVHYLIAQTIGAGVIAALSYFLYRRYIFATRS